MQSHVSELKGLLQATGPHKEVRCDGTVQNGYLHNALILSHTFLEGGLPLGTLSTSGSPKLCSRNLAVCPGAL